MTIVTLEPPTTVSDPLATTQALLPRIRDLAIETELTGRVPQPLVDQLIEAGLFHLLLPRSLGGSETDPVTAARVVELLASADASTGWVAMLAMQNSYMAGFLPETGALEVWANQGVVSGTARPIGRAVPVSEPEPGYVISGTWPFASGSSHATWFSAECVVYDGDEPRLDEEGNQFAPTFFVSRADVTVRETWNTTGLRGTASNDFTIDGVFVPERRTFRTLIDPPVHDWALYRALPLLFMNQGAHALGVASGAIEEARAAFSTRNGWGGVPLAEQPRFQAAIAEAVAKVQSARAYIYSSAEELWHAVQADADTPELRARVRLATSHAASASLEAVDLLHRTMATSAVMTGAPIERQFRDLHTAAAHVMVGPLTYEAAGRVELGSEASFPYF